MPYTWLAGGMIGILAIFTSCTAVSTFPDNGGKTIDTPAAFDQLLETPQQWIGQPIKVAGRISRVESLPEGVTFSAIWLPYPAKGHFEPEAGAGKESSLGRRMSLLYPQPLDSFLSLQGNMFIAIGQLSNIRDTSTFMGATTTLPQITIQCIRVWKTGSSDLNVAPDTENTGYPPMVKTYCVSP